MILFTLSSCAVLEHIKKLGGQSGGTQNNITVPIGDNRKQNKLGDENKFNDVKEVTINKMTNISKDIIDKFGTILLVIVFLFALLIRKPGDKKTIQFLENMVSGLKQNDREMKHNQQEILNKLENK